MNEPRGPRSYHDWSSAPAGSDGTAREGMQGQLFTRVVDGDNAPGSPLCQVGIRMRPGKVSTPHTHREVHVYVHVRECGIQGVLTLWGDALENEEWSFAGDTLWIPPGVPHVAVYPTFRDTRFDGDDYVNAPTLHALETRTTPDPEHDVVPLPELWPVLGGRLTELRLLGQVDLPPQLVASGREV